MPRQDADYQNVALELGRLRIDNSNATARSNWGGFHHGIWFRCATSFASLIANLRSCQRTGHCLSFDIAPAPRISRRQRGHSSTAVEQYKKAYAIRSSPSPFSGERKYSKPRSSISILISFGFALGSIMARPHGRYKNCFMPNGTAAGI